jgi:putative peptidoglycan lipid II flippase
MLLAMPAAVALLVLAHPIAQALFERGAFGPADTAGAAAALTGLAAGLPFGVAGKVLAQPLFALERLRPAVLAVALGLLVTVAAGFVLAGRFGVLGVGLGASLGFAAHAAALAAALKAKGLWRPDGRLKRRVLAIAAASAVMGAGLIAVDALLPDSSTMGAGPRAGLLATLCLSGLALYGVAAAAFRAVTREDLAALRRPA